MGRVIVTLPLVLTALLAGTTSFAQVASAAELDRAGWDAIRANRLLEAAERFRDALRVEPRNVRLLLGAGLAAHLLGRSDEARQLLTAAVQIDAGLTEASLLLGQLLYGDGDLPAAIHVYEQALAHSPKDTLLLSRLESWRRELELHDRFAQRAGHRFTVLFEGPNEEAIASRALELLDAAYWRIGTALGAYPPGIITVVLYTNEQFRDITRSPSWAAAAFDGRIRVPIRGALRSPEGLERVLAHEFTHALVHSIAPRGVPQWLNEGLAQFFEPGPKTNARELVGRMAGAAGENSPGPGLIPLTRLEQSFEGLEPDQARLAYAQSAVAVLALVDQAGLPGVLNLLFYLGRGDSTADAFERATFRTYTEFVRTWAAR